MVARGGWQEAGEAVFIPPHYYCLLYAPSSFYFWFINMSIPLIGDYPRSLSASFVPVPPPPPPPPSPTDVVTVHVSESKYNTSSSYVLSS